MFTGCSVRLTDDVAGVLDGMRPLTAMYVGGMGSATHNFHRDAMARRGFPDEAARIHELWMAGRKDEAVAAVPDEYLEQSALLGDEQRIRRRWASWSPPAGTTGLIVDAPGVEELRLAADTEGWIMTYETILVDTPAEYIRRVTLNRPEKRNAISPPMRIELLDALRAHDNDADVRVTVIRGAGACFSAGYDLSSAVMTDDAPFYSAPGDGQWARQANDTWFSIWDLAKPVIAQIHGYAIAGAPSSPPRATSSTSPTTPRSAIRSCGSMSPPDWQYHTVLLGMRRAMELMLTGDPITGIQAEAIGFANRSFPAADLDESVLAVAGRVAGVPSDLAQINKRSRAPRLRRLGRAGCHPRRHRAPGARGAHAHRRRTSRRVARTHERREPGIGTTDAEVVVSGRSIVEPRCRGWSPRSGPCRP